MKLRSRETRRTRVAAYAVIIGDGGLLLSRFVFGDEPQWTLPGGGLDHGEDPLAAVVREITEETGYECEVDRLLGVEGRRVQLTRRQRVDMHAVRVFYEAHVVGGELRHEKNGSTDRAEWFHLDSVSELVRSELVDRGLRYVADRPATGNLA